MLVIRGYEDGRLITNDVGTRHGKNFTYKNETLMDAIHDWDNAATNYDEGILKGAKKVLVVRP